MIGSISFPSLATLLSWLALIVLAALAALAIATVVLTRRTESAHPPLGRFVAAPDGTRVHYRDSGPPDAPALLLVHGANTSLLDFETSLRPRLEGEFRVIAVDRPGSGWSEARADAAGEPVAQAALAVTVLDALGLERAIWVGHSWGGAVVMAALVEMPERVDAAVTIAGATHPWEEKLPGVIRLAATPGLGHLLAATLVEPLGRVALDGALTDSFKPESPPVPIGEYREVTGSDLTIRPRAFRATALDLVGLSDALARLVPRYADIERPLLVINGSGDPLVPPARNAERVLAAVPHARSLLVDGAGHIVHHTHADEVAARIAAFVRATR